ncbi:uncharacterized protein [Palaemon carinicauda]|uniref:uncharacterized protein n=1 Tax=Palaemon carinicauda TaxID=392227 RepID=UPI0035B6A362
MGLSDEALLNFIEKKIKDSDKRDKRYAEREERALKIKYEENDKQREMRLFLKERKPRTPEDYSSLADTYSSAHKCYNKDEQKYFRHNANVSSPSDKISMSEKPEKTNLSRPGKIACYGCGQSGHISRNCPNKLPKKKSKSSLEIGQVLDNTVVCRPMVCGTVNGITVSTILRDTGCTGVVVSEDLIPDPGTNCSYSTLIDYLGKKDRFPIVKIYLKCNPFTGWVNAVRAPIKYCTVLLGNIPGVQDHSLFPRKNTDSLIEVNAVTRAQARRRNIVHPLSLPELFDMSIDHESLLREQQTCEALKYAREMSQSGDVKCCKNGLQYEFVMRNGLFNRKIQKCKKPQLLVVPVKCIKLVLRLANDIPVSGHFSHRKTFNKINGIFWWQGMTSDIYKYCKSCDVCQKSTLVGKVKKAKMVKLPVISMPFYRVAIDLMGPISPPSEAGHRYILTMVDYASSFLDAVALKNITSEDIAEALISIFSRVGEPKEILSDRGPQFRSELMLQVHKLLGVKPLFSTPYHPAANGRIGRQHQILKSILKKICELKT